MSKKQKSKHKFLTTCFTCTNGSIRFLGKLLTIREKTICDYTERNEGNSRILILIIIEIFTIVNSLSVNLTHKILVVNLGVGLLLLGQCDDISFRLTI